MPHRTGVTETAPALGSGALCAAGLRFSSLMKRNPAELIFSI
jgi:hypothetical protein